MNADRFAVVFEKLNESIVENETMKASFVVETSSDAEELDELRRLALEFAPATPQTYTAS